MCTCESGFWGTCLVVCAALFWRCRGSTSDNVYHQLTCFIHLVYPSVEWCVQVQETIPLSFFFFFASEASNA